MRLSREYLLLLFLSSTSFVVTSASTNEKGRSERRYLKPKHVMKFHDDVDPRAAIETRIINGVDALRGRHNYFARMYGKILQCGGSLIAPDVIITNAHCQQLLTTVALAQYDVKDDGGQGVAFRTISKEIPHPDYEPDEITGTFRNDLMLVKLDRAATKTLIKLNMDQNVPSQSEDELIMLGFGLTSFNGPAPTTLKIADTKYIAPEQCLPLLCLECNSINEFPPDIMCTKLDDPLPTRHCFGDSGGPIVKRGDTADDDVLVAVIQSSTSNCGESEQDSPDENSNIAYNLDWIIETGCELSENPPDYWNCEDLSSPTKAPTTFQTTEMPSDVPISVPTNPPTPNLTSQKLRKIYVQVIFDSHPLETGWFIADENYEEFRVGIPAGAYRSEFGFTQFSGVREKVELIVGKRYQFTIQDSAGDGMCCGREDCCALSGSYKVITEEGVVLVEGGAEFENSKTQIFTVPATR